MLGHPDARAARSCGSPGGLVRAGHHFGDSHMSVPIGQEPGTPRPSAARRPAIRGLPAEPAAGHELRTKMSSGRNADTSMLGTSTTWLILRSTATLQIV